jgi:excisionase family DNA binding protein
MKEVDEKPLLTLEQVAIKLNTSYPTVRLWEKQGKIPSIRIGRTVRFSPDVIESLSKISMAEKGRKNK